MSHRVVHLTTVHRWDDTRIFHKECRSLASAGYEVTLISRAPSHETFNDVRVVPLPRSYTSRFARLTLGSWDIFKLAIKASGSVYHFHDPELIPVGLMLKLFNKKVVYDVHESVPEQILSKHWIPLALRRPAAIAVNILESLSARVFDRIVAARADTAEAFPPSKTVLIQNYALSTEFERASRVEWSTRQNRVAYIGGITRIRGVLETIRALDLVREPGSVRLDLGGVFGDASLHAELQSDPGWRHVDYHGWLSRSEVDGILSRCQAGIVLFHPAPNHDRSYPNKLFEYMSAGIPIVASNFPYWKQFVEDLGTGIMVNPRDPQEIANAIQWLVDHPLEAAAMGQRGREAVKTRYSWEPEAQHLVRMYSELLWTAPDNDTR